MPSLHWGEKRTAGLSVCFLPTLRVWLCLPQSLLVSRSTLTSAQARKCDAAWGRNAGRLACGSPLGNQEPPWHTVSPPSALAAESPEPGRSRPHALAAACCHQGLFQRWPTCSTYFFSLIRYSDVPLLGDIFAMLFDPCQPAQYNTFGRMLLAG